MPYFYIKQNNNTMNLSLFNTENGVLPSGVSYSIRELLSSDQSHFVKDSKKGTVYLASNMVGSCLTSLGDNDSPTKDTAKTILETDLQYLLLRIHMLSFYEDSDELDGGRFFKFAVQFPKDKGSKDIPDPEMNLINLETVKVKPFKWVSNYIEENSWEKTDDSEFPKMFDSYDEMLKIHGVQSFKYKKKDVQYTLPTSKSASRAIATFKDSNDDLEQSLYARRFCIIDNKGKEQQITSFQDTPARFSEECRKHYLRTEGKVSSTVTITSQLDESKQVTIDLLQTGEFYIPSVAE